MAEAAAQGHRGWHSRGYLPHFDGGEVPQAVTFRTAGSVPAELLRTWEEELRRLPHARADVVFRARVERYLDRRGQPGPLAESRVAAVVQNALRHFDGERYELHAWVVMPNHVHALFMPLADHGVPSIIHSWKSFTAQQANRILGRSGPFWHLDYFDRFIRNGRHFDRAQSYIEHNPVEAGLCAAPEDWPFSSAVFRSERP